jgi:hypothetical protein
VTSLLFFFFLVRLHQIFFCLFILLLRVRFHQISLYFYFLFFLYVRTRGGGGIRTSNYHFIKCCPFTLEQCDLIFFFFIISMLIFFRIPFLCNSYHYSVRPQINIEFYIYFVLFFPCPASSIRADSFLVSFFHLLQVAPPSPRRIVQNFASTNLEYSRNKFLVFNPLIF